MLRTSKTEKILVFAFVLCMISSTFAVQVSFGDQGEKSRLEYGEERGERKTNSISMFTNFFEMDTDEAMDLYRESYSYPGSPRDEDAVRFAKVDINEDVISAGGLNSSTSIEFNVFEESYTLNVNPESVKVGENEISYGGDVEGSFFGFFTFSSHEGKVSTTVRLPEIGRGYEVNYNADAEEHYVYGRCREDFNHELQNPIDSSVDDSRDTTDADIAYSSTVEVDMMIVYTSSAESWASNNEGSINNLINEARDTTNTMLENSNTLTRINIVHTAEVDYFETGDDVRTDLDRLRTKDDGYMEEIHDWRDYHGADLVSLLVKTDDDYNVAGVAMAPDEEHKLHRGNGFSLTCVEWATSSNLDAFPHEVGHNFGAGHAKDQDRAPGPQLYDYSAGWRWKTGTIGFRRRYRTVMAYNTYDWGLFEYEQVPYFSNPDIEHHDNDEPIGHPEDGDNARTLRETRSTVADYQSPTPQIELLSPEDGEEWDGGSEQDIWWESQGGHHNDVERIELFYSTDDGETWTTIAEDHSDGDGYGSYSWDVPNKDTTALLRVKAIDGAGYSRATSNEFKIVDRVVEEHQLDLDSSSGGSVMEPGEGTHGPYDSGTVVDLVAEADDDWVFDEWTGDVGFVGDTDSSETFVRMEDDYSITANFEDKTYTLDLDSGPGGSVTEPGEGTHGPYDPGTPVDLEAEADDGWVFDEWTGDVSYVGDTDSSETFVRMEEDYSITAEFVTADKYDLTVGSTAGGTVDEPGEGTYTYHAGTVVDLVAKADEHSQFVGWRGDIDTVEDPKSADTEMKMDGNKEITAEFEMVTYTLDLMIEGDGVVDIEPEKEEYEPEEEVDLTAIAEEHWYFDRWTGDVPEGEYGEEITIVMDDDKEITAHFEKHAYSLDVMIEGQGVVDIEPEKEEYEPEEEVDLTAIAEEHWYFEEWTGDVPEGEYGEDITIVMDDDKEITVHFEEHTYSLDVMIEGQGVVDIEPEKEEYEPEEEVDLTAIAEEHWYFDRWTGDVPEGGYGEEITIMMDEDKEITVHFEEHTYALDVSVEGKGSVEVEPDEEEYEPGTEISLTANPEEGWYFDGWSGSHEGKDENITITMDSEKEITAVFTEQVSGKYNLTINIEGKGAVEIDGEEVEDDWVATYEEDTEVELKAIPPEDQYFEGWTGDYTGTEEEITVTMDEDKEITVNFKEIDEEMVTLTIDVEGEGSTRPLEGTHTYEEGKEITITAAAAEDWYFVEWKGDHTSTDDEITITIDEDKEIRAIFERYETGVFELNVTDYDKTVREGEGIIVEYAVTNIGEGEGTQNIEFWVDEEKVDWVTLTLGPGEDHTGEFNWMSEKAGQYELELLGENSRDIVRVTVEEEVELDDEDDEDDESDDSSLLFDYWWLITLVVIGGIIAIGVAMAGRRKELSSQRLLKRGVAPLLSPMKSSKEKTSQQQQQVQKARKSPQQQQSLRSPLCASEEEKHKCPDCGNKVRYIHQYDRWYCDSCQSYKSVQSGGGKATQQGQQESNACPDCGGKVRYIDQYDRWYCDSCQDYKSVQATQQQQQESNACPDCREELSYIDEYDRWYCGTCQEYK